MDTAHIKHQLSVHKQPGIIITAERKDHIFPCGNISLIIRNSYRALFRNDKILLHAHPEMVIYGFQLIQQINTLSIFLTGSPYSFVLKAVEWEKACPFLIPALNTDSLIILIDLVCSRIITGMVDAALVAVLIG